MVCELVILHQIPNIFYLGVSVSNSAENFEEETKDEGMALSVDFPVCRHRRGSMFGYRGKRRILVVISSNYRRSVLKRKSLSGEWIHYGLHPK